MPITASEEIKRLAPDDIDVAEITDPELIEEIVATFQPLGVGEAMPTSFHSQEVKFSTIRR